jgi:uncharacterized protein
VKSTNLPVVVIVIATGILGFLAAGHAQGRTSGQEQCSLAAVSRALGRNAPVCDTTTVQQMARTGHAFEQNEMGIASMLAIGPDYSTKEALAWFERAAQYGYPPAEVNLAIMYINGWGTPVNYWAAQHWLRAAAKRHFARAYYNLGILYLEGKGVTRDSGKAFRWFQKGASAGDSSAQTNLGYLYDQGLGCQRSVATAAVWYRKAALAGNPLGENNLADLYLRGEGVQQNDAAAFFWFEKAAAQGQTGARIKLGYMYAEGRGTGKDPQTAYAWISAASMAGDPRGQEMLHSLAQVLNAKQVDEARDRALRLQRVEQQLSVTNFTH